MKKILSVLLIAMTQWAFAQTDSSKGVFTFSGYAEAYYCYDFNQPDNHELPSFLYNFKRHNEVNLNLGFINANYTARNVRANFGLMAGTWAQYNSSAEQPLLQHVWQANIGVKLCRNKNLWIDGGILPSHIGFESAMGKTCDALTRCIIGDNTPSYQGGVKLGYTSDNSKWFLAALVVNGWQHITRPNGNNTPAFGTQITFTPNAKATLNYSTFIGNDKPDTLKQMRYYHNLYGIFHPTDKFGITIGFDYCMEQKSTGSSDYNNLFSPVLILKYQFTDKFSMTARGEFYSDKNGIIIATGTENGFQTSGISLNADFAPAKNVLWRIEGRTLNSKDQIFVKDNEGVNTDTFVTTSLAVSF
jgi:hypothetical protein